MMNLAETGPWVNLAGPGQMRKTYPGEMSRFLSARFHLSSTVAGNHFETFGHLHLSYVIQDFDCQREALSWAGALVEEQAKTSKDEVVPSWEIADLVEEEVKMWVLQPLQQVLVFWCTATSRY